MTDDILDRIDGTLEAWEMGPDAARWRGEPAEEEPAPERGYGGYFADVRIRFTDGTVAECHGCRIQTAREGA